MINASLNGRCLYHWPVGGSDLILFQRLHLTANRALNPALDAGDNSLVATSLLDSRGETRIVDLAGISNLPNQTIDLGAFELQTTVVRRKLSWLSPRQSMSLTNLISKPPCEKPSLSLIPLTEFSMQRPKNLTLEGS